MIDNNSTKQSLLELADQVREYDVGAAVRLRLLSDAVENGTNAEVWVESDIYKIIDPDGIVERFRSSQIRGKIVDILELLRNTFILAPIIVTWYGISQATDKYHILLGELLKTHPDQVSQPFLYLWQEGFGGRLPLWLTLSNVALIDAGLLVFIFFLTFFTFALAQSNANRSEREAQQLRSALVHALAGTSLFLLSRRKQVPLTAGDNLEAVARQYDAMTRQTGAKFDNMIQQILNQFNAMTKQVVEQFSATTKQVLNQFNAMTQKMDDQLNAGNAYLQKLNTFASDLDVLAKEMHTSAQTLRNTNNDLVASVNGLVGPAKELSEQQRRLADSVKESVALLQGSAKMLVDLSRKQDAWSSDLSDVLDTLNIAVEKAVQLASSTGNFTNQQSSFLQQLGKERDAQRELALLMSDATISVKEALASIGEGGRSLRSMAHDMKDIADLQRSSDNSSIVQTYAHAAQVIEKSGNSLNASAIAIYDAGQKLSDMIDELQNHLARPVK